MDPEESWGMTSSLSSTGMVTGVLMEVSAVSLLSFGIVGRNMREGVVGAGEETGFVVVGGEVTVVLVGGVTGGVTGLLAGGVT